MPLNPGTTLGPYHVTAKIGEGGMGEVYRARDTKLDREVALKILPEAFASDPDRLVRFQREAQVLASLNHPGIAAIYGLEEAEDTRALLLELVEGPTLADRIVKGPTPADEALPTTKQIAEVVEMGENVYRATDMKRKRHLVRRRLRTRSQSWSFVVAGLCLSMLAVGCAGPESDTRVLTADLPLHLEDHLDVATVEGAEIPTDLPDPVEWRFDEPQPGWKPAYGNEFVPEALLVVPVQTRDGLRVTLEKKHVDANVCGNVYTDLPNWQPQEWDHVEVEARASGGRGQGHPGSASWRMLGLGFNLTDPARATGWQALGLFSSIVTDGAARTYRLSPTPVQGDFDGIWKQLDVWFCASEPSTIDLLSVKVIPKEAAFTSAPAGVSAPSGWTDSLAGPSTPTCRRV